MKIGRNEEICLSCLNYIHQIKKPFKNRLKENPSLQMLSFFLYLDYKLEILFHNFSTWYKQKQEEKVGNKLKVWFK
jgi:hypothetical protein